jgi:hypothetical protein
MTDVPNPWPRLEPMPSSVDPEDRVWALIHFLVQLQKRASDSLVGDGAIEDAFASIERELAVLSVQMLTMITPRPEAEATHQPDSVAAPRRESKA